MDPSKEYQVLVGRWLSSFRVEKCILQFDFCNSKSRDENNLLRLWTIADMCLSEDNLFKTASEYDTFRPEVLPVIYSCLEESVIAFEPLPNIRACRMSFASASFFFWAIDDELPRSFFEAREFEGNALKRSWEIGYVEF